MRRWMGWMCLAAVFAAQASSGTLRVGGQVLVVGDSAARVLELLGKPSYKTREKTASSTHAKSHGKGRRTAGAAPAGEQWQYRDGNRTMTIVVVDGRVSAIRDGGR